MFEIRLPRLVGSRLAAKEMVTNLHDEVRGERVVLNCRDLRSGSPSFADEIVKRVLVEGEAAELVVLGAADDFLAYVNRSAEARSVGDRVSSRPAGSEVGA
jgi:hypothetical protein